jgi:hypothetical protein
MTKWERRCRRESQQKYRKLGPSPATILENTQVVLCVERGLINITSAAQILRVGINEFRQMRVDVNNLALTSAEELDVEY